MSVTWKERLAAKIPEVWKKEIDAYELDLELRKQGKIEEKLFAETRLRRGAYGQRYDHGQRHDGDQVQELAFPDVATKGPNTKWDAPGMQRIKLPWGGVSADQLEVLAELAEEYSDAIIHVTTRQDVQLHYVHIDDTPDLMRRLGAVGITTKEACGNSVRNVTGCHLAGVCKTESFDVTPHADALATFLLGHPDAQDFGRKFKIAFSGCAENACGLANMHDLGYIARERDGARGFELWVGGGLGAVPHEAQLYSEFIPETEILPIAQAICRVFGRLGEKKNRHRSRMKFLVAKLGIEAFKQLVEEERPKLEADPRWTGFIAAIPKAEARSAPPLVQLGRASQEAPLSRGSTPDSAYDVWRRTNVADQRQPGRFVVSVSLPLGDLSSDQARALAQIARDFSGGHLRATVEQNFVLRDVAEASLPALFEALSSAGLAEATAGTLVDVTACPGTDTCKLGISSSRGLAGELRTRLAVAAIAQEEAARNLRIKVSGCFNSCGQHHLADLGFYGVSRKKGDHVVPHFQVVLGGMWQENAGSFGLAMGAVPSRHIPEVVDRVLQRFLAERTEGERFQDFIERLGKAKVKGIFEDLLEIPTFAERPEAYTDWGDARVYSMKDHGVGECAGEVVSSAEFGLQASERKAFEAQLLLEAKDLAGAVGKSLESMLAAALALVRLEVPGLGEDSNRTVVEFRARYYDTQVFFDPFAGGKFASYLFRAHETPLPSPTFEAARQRVEEAQLFIEAAHACHLRLGQRGSA